MKKMLLPVAALLGLLLPASGGTASNPSCFARALPADIRDNRLDDVKLLLGWVFDADAAQRLPKEGDIVNRHSGLARVQGFGGATDLSALRGRYRVMRAPFDAGRGYFGIELGALDADGHVSSLFLANRLFRLPIILQQPIGLMTDLGTNVAMLGGWRTNAVVDADTAAVIALADAERLQVPLLTVGQSQAGGEAQQQAAWLALHHPRIPAGFITFNAASVMASVRHLGLAPEQVDGINFVKDLDPGFGPHGVIPNRIGLEVYIHPDGSGGDAPGAQSFFATLRHAGEHLLSAFNAVPLGKTLESVLARAPESCPLQS